MQRASEQDFAAICALLKEFGLPYEDLSPLSLDQFWVVKDADGVTGVIGMEQSGEVALLRSLAVAQPRQGQGWGSRLVAHLERLAKEAGVNSLYLLTTTARDFFTQRGYQVINRQEAPEALQASSEFASLCPDTAVCMVKNMA